MLYLRILLAARKPRACASVARTSSSGPSSHRAMPMSDLGVDSLKRMNQNPFQDPSSFNFVFFCFFLFFELFSFFFRAQSFERNSRKDQDCLAEKETPLLLRRQFEKFTSFRKCYRFLIRLWKILCPYFNACIMFIIKRHAGNRATATDGQLFSILFFLFF